ncbi:DNA topoisomerase (ATP-hydrolyzing) subunit B [Mycoplasma miroungirhinis]|uniref:DNA gyrase subunit B n=1 Tax=Mycoplasma miroungirhinis TaxID=754516 RepID=A0A6M4JDR7_9MOLU|nr:DNA topoisomerase (ATP-hydrolyzing) subunit B [Mycoplasma miroungirhinis]QJR44216.1 DNA topoisomerase (ATP-hydrolyzing) subunit B [Mycoplasma miroungirhinis]
METKNNNNTNEAKNQYTANNIQVLEGLEAVRTRPGMYIGSIGFKGLHHLIWEIVDNSVDEAMAGFCDEITINLHPNNIIEVSDNGRGIPVDKHPKTGISTVETVFTVLHAGGKFDSESYKVSGGLHGVGASVVNALSDDFQVWVKKHKNVYYQHFSNGGKPTDSLKIIDTFDNEETGTRVMFHPDFTIMEKNNFDFGLIADRAKQTAYLNKGLRINVNDLTKQVFKSFYFEGGIVDYVLELSKGKKTINPDIIYAEGSFLDSRIPNASDVLVEVAMQYNETYSSNIVSYANNISTNEGGTHEQGFNDALVRIFNKWGEENKLIKQDKERLTKDDVKDGLVAIISIKHTNPIFEGQTKGKLENKDARSATNKVLSETLERYLSENPAIAKSIIEKCLKAQHARLAAKAASEASRKRDGLDFGNLPGKLADSSLKNAELTELFIVEGNSAGGSAKMGRDRSIQAILPLRGKVINSEKNSIQSVLENKEIGTLIHALGTGIRDEFNINKLRYHKIIIMTDADVDGAHITTLLLTFFYRYMRPLIEYGFVYLAQPPLYKITYGKTVKYAYKDEQKDEILANIDKSKVSIQRYKGLGEMDPEQLWETTMNPENRKMLQVQIQDLAAADTIFTTLMGEEVEPRREFVQENARYASNIDF